MQDPRWPKILLSPLLLGYMCFTLLLSYAIFYFPYYFPPIHRVSSDSYVFGFNNSVAILSIVAFLAIATLIHLVTQWSLQPQTATFFPDASTDAVSRVPPSLYWLLALLYLLFTMTIYWKAQLARFYSIDWESSYFLWRLKLMDIYGLLPYSDFQFDYGPALIYPLAYFHRLLSGWSASYEISYYIFHYFTDLLGLYCIYALLNRSIMPKKYKIISFLILAFASFAPYMGLNGISLRFLAPYLTLVLIHYMLIDLHQKALWFAVMASIALVFLAIVVNISISAEIGIAFSISFVLYSCYSIRRSFYMSIASLFAFTLAFSLCRMFFPTSYYEAMFSFSKGANNFPLLPAAHLLLYIVTLFFAIPKLIATSILDKHSNGPLLFGLGILSIALMPGALGRCDPPHVFFYGLGISLLTFILLANTKKKYFLLYAVTYTGIFIIAFQWSNIRVFNLTVDAILPKDIIFNIGTKLGFKWLGEMNEKKDTRAFETHEVMGSFPNLSVLDKYPQLELPFANYGTDKITEQYLWTKRKISPEYYMGAVGVYTEADLARKIRDIAHNEYLLILKKYANFHENRDTCSERLHYIRRSFIYPVALPCKQEGLDTHVEIFKYIATSYQIIETIGDFIVLKRVE